MTIKSSGTLNTTEIAAEWGGSQPNSLSEYYAGGLWFMLEQKMVVEMYTLIW